MSLDDLNKRIEALGVGEQLRLEGVPEDVYHSSKGFGSSKLKSFIKCPQLFKAELDGLHKTTPAMIIGSAFHMAVLEPERFIEHYAVAPVINRRTKEGKAQWEALQSSTKEYLSPDDYAKVIAMRDSCKSKFEHFLKDGSPEVSVWRKHESGLTLKARIDWLIGDLAVDLKSTVDVFDFAYQARKYRYDYQAVHYLWVCEGIASEMVFLPTASTEPYLSGRPLIIDEQRLYDRSMRWQTAVNELADALAFDIWAGLPDEPEILELKPWEAN